MYKLEIMFLQYDTSRSLVICNYSLCNYVQLGAICNYIGCVCNYKIVITNLP
jgi:hypothetical protein